MSAPVPIGVIGRQLVEAAGRLAREERLLGCQGGGSYYHCITLTPSEVDQLSAMLAQHGFFLTRTDDGIEVMW